MFNLVVPKENNKSSGEMDCHNQSDESSMIHGKDSVKETLPNIGENADGTNLSRGSDGSLVVVTAIQTESPRNSKASMSHTSMCAMIFQKNSK